MFRWNNEVQEAANSKHPMVQCHAIALQHAVRSSDRQAVSKLVSGLTRGNVKGPLSSMSQCLLIRYVSQVGSIGRLRSKTVMCEMLISLS